MSSRRRNRELAGRPPVSPVDDSGGTEPSPRIDIGEVVRPHGVTGELVVLPMTDDPERFAELLQVFLDGEDGPVGVLGVRFHGDRLLVRLAGVEDRSAADRLRGRRLQTILAEVAPLQDDEYYWFELQGCTVEDERQGVVGRVSGVDRIPSGELLVVDTSTVAPTPGGAAREVLIPFVKAIVRSVDLAQRRIVISAPDGLLDL